MDYSPIYTVIMPIKKSSMTATEFRARLKEADIRQRRFAIWLGLDPRTVNRWATNNEGAVPQYAAVMVNLLARYPDIAAEARNSQ
jgi:DNA-binding transcriptional regulator YiaG